MTAQSRFVYVTYIRTTPDRLWSALTEPEFTRLWWAGMTQVSDWTPGAEWKNMIPDGRVGDAGEILEIDRPRRLVLTWRVEFQPDMKAEGHSTLTYDLEPAGSSVKLTLTHETQTPNSKVIGAVSEGWPHLLASLKSLLETGEAIAETATWPKDH
ncbi:MAG: SRPBCC family protein [Alphaproteobacteria bacterium]|nr:SRPBCC family protein [Alphaproteobacteria bacterium]